MTVRRPIRYLAFLAVLSALGWLTGNPLFYGFFGFLGFANFPDVHTGPRFHQHMAFAGRNALFTVVALFPLVAAVPAVVEVAPVYYPVVFAGSFALQMLVFSFSLYFLENPNPNKKL